MFSIVSFVTHICSRGFYPLGRGEVIVDVKPVDTLNAITLLDRGDPKIIRGIVYGSGPITLCF